MRTHSALAAALTISYLAFPSQAAEEPRYAAVVERLVSPLTEGGLVPAVSVGIWKDGQTEFHSFGTFTPGGERAPDADTLYEIGSITKVFTATLLTDAARRGELALDDPLSAHMPEGTTAPLFEGMELTLAMLASHLSALPRLPDNLDLANTDDPYGPYDEALLWEFLDGYTLASAPGEGYVYSNLGSGLLGTVVARAADDSYEDLLRARITGPLGMDDTVIELDAEQAERFAPPFLPGGTPATNWTFDALAGAGAIRSTARDLVRFGVAQLEPTGTDLDEAIAATHERQAALPPPGGWIAIGWHIAADGSTLMHGGQTGGYNCSLYVSEPLNLVVAMLSNAGEQKSSMVAEQIVQAIAGMPVEPISVRQAAEIDPSRLDRLAGTYAAKAMPLTYTIVHRDGALIAELPGQPALRVWPESDVRFFYREVEADLVFDVPDDGGPATAVTLFQGGQEIRFERTE